MDEKEPPRATTNSRAAQHGRLAEKKHVVMFGGQLLCQASKCMVEVLLEYFDACTFLGFSQVQAIQFSHVTHVQHKTDTGTSLLNQT